MEYIQPRTWLIEAREALGMDRQQFGKACGCSEQLIYLLEEIGTITHPQIAVSIVRRLGLGVDRYNDLVHKSHHARVVPRETKPKAPEGLYSKAFGI